MMTSCLLRVKVHALWVQKSELFYPVAFPSSSQIFVKASHDFKDCNPEIVQGMAWAVEMARYWFLCPPVCDVAMLCVMLRCPLKRIWRGFCVSPTYCFRHFLHSIK